MLTHKKPREKRKLPWLYILYTAVYKASVNTKECMINSCMYWNKYQKHSC